MNCLLLYRTIMWRGNKRTYVLEPQNCYFIYLWENANLPQVSYSTSLVGWLDLVYIFTSIKGGRRLCAIFYFMALIFGNYIKTRPTCLHAYFPKVACQEYTILKTAEHLRMDKLFQIYPSLSSYLMISEQKNLYLPICKGLVQVPGYSQDSY